MTPVRVKMESFLELFTHTSAVLIIFILYYILIYFEHPQISASATSSALSYRRLLREKSAQMPTPKGADAKGGEMRTNR